MSKRFKRGLVVGKFAPLHKGHQLLINRALEECDELVLISYTNPEFSGCEPAKRRLWLNKLYPEINSFVLGENNFNECFPDGPWNGIPPNDADELTHRRFCGEICQRVLGGPVNAVFTSEGYGPGFAEELTRMFSAYNGTRTLVEHVDVDLGRQQHSISGTEIRKKVHRYRHWLSPVVYSDFVERVCLLGGESTGKSSFSKDLADVFETNYVPEYGRTLWEERGGVLEYEDMLKIARRQCAYEDEAAQAANRFLFCDTSPMTTLLYSQELFGMAEEELVQLSYRPYHHVFLCAPDFPFVQDGTRRDDSFRQKQHDWYVKKLHERLVPYRLLKGDRLNRLKIVREVFT